MINIFNHTNNKQKLILILSFHFLKYLSTIKNVIHILLMLKKIEKYKFYDNEKLKSTK